MQPGGWQRGVPPMIASEQPSATKCRSSEQIAQLLLVLRVQDATQRVIPRSWGKRYAPSSRFSPQELRYAGMPQGGGGGLL